jgi:hypothetical protein
MKQPNSFGLFVNPLIPPRAPIEESRLVLRRMMEAYLSNPIETRAAAARAARYNGLQLVKFREARTMPTAAGSLRASEANDALKPPVPATKVRTPTNQDRLEEAQKRWDSVTQAFRENPNLEVPY